MRNDGMLVQGEAPMQARAAAEMYIYVAVHM